MITQSELKERLHYAPETGVFTWIKPASNRVAVGSVASAWRATRKGEKRLSINVNGRRYEASRLVWLYVYGEFPDTLVDHVDTDPGNNKVDNLRKATNQENLFNQGPFRNNTSGFKGVSWDKDREKWLAKAILAGKQRFLGRMPHQN